MRKLLILALSVISLTIMAQVPQGVGYQGVATDANGIELVNQSISIRASVLSGSATGTIEWEETHATSTDTFGLFTLTIGQGTNTTNGLQTSFADISWGTNTHFLKIEMDVTGGSAYSNMGTNQMMSVPYALFAESANINYDSISNFLSGDSTFITNVGGGMGGDGCDYAYPDGLDGVPIQINLLNSNYTVPSGKNLYIIYVNKYGGSNTYLTVNGLRHSEINETSFHSSAEQPLIVESGDELSYNWGANPTEINAYGILIDAVIEPVQISLLNSNYTVPTGKKLYLMYVNKYGGSNTYLTVNGLRHSEINETSFHSSAEQPLIVKSGDELSYNWGANPTEINAYGYLADENYFAGCGGGGSSSTSSLDSTAIANMIAGAGGGCDWRFPDGLTGTPIIWHLPGNDYTVPSGKNLYITSFAGYNSGHSMKIDGLEIIDNNRFEEIIIVPTGSVVSTTSVTSVDFANFNGILVDANVTPVIWHLPGNDYTVPSGKNLYITSFAGYNSGHSMKIDGLEIIDNNRFEKIIIVATGSVVSTTSVTSVDFANFNGYLVDENYFANCGGNSSSGPNTGNPTNPTGNVTSTLTDDSQINGYRIFYIRSNQIYESDSAFSFENKLYESTSSEYPLNYSMINHLFVDETNEILYFLESSSVSGNATYVRKTSLKDFNPETVFIIPERISYISDLRVSPTSNEIHWSIGNNNSVGLYKYQQGISQLVSGIVNAFCFDNNGDYFYSNGSNLYDSQGTNIYSGSNSIEMIQYDNNSGEFFMANGGGDYIWNSQSTTLYNSQGYSITDIDIDNGSDEIIFSVGSTVMNIDFSGNSRVCGISYASIFSIAIFEKGTIDSSLVYNLNSYVLNDESYWYVNSSRIYESDTSQLLNHNELYSSYGNAGFLSSVFFDQNNQEVYYLESPNNSANATYVKKTSIQSFNPQTVFIIPERITYISDLKVNPNTNEIYWSIGSNNNVGLYKYQQSISQLVSGNVDAFCFDNSGDYYYADGSVVYNSQGNNLYNSPSSIDILHYDNNSSTFFMAQGGSDQIWDSQGNTIYDSYGYSITDFDINEQTQKIIFSCAYSINIMDLDGLNFSVLEMRSGSSYYITIIE